MFGLSALMAAIARLTNAIDRTATTMEAINIGLRERVGLDHDDAETSRLPAPEAVEAGRNGRKGK